MKARFWWKLRRAWHKSDVYAECCWPEYSSKYFWHFHWACLWHIVKRNLLWYDFKVFWRRAWRGFRVIQPFGCKSYWTRDKSKTFQHNGETCKTPFRRTWYRPQWWYSFTIHVCEWLEYKARDKEEPGEVEHFNPFSRPKKIKKVVDKDV